MSHSVYRLFDGGGNLLYVGYSAKPHERIRQHTGRPWWSEVMSHTVLEYPTRSEALAAERTAIRSERPRHNAAHHPNPLPRPYTDLRMELPDDIHRKLKAKAALEGITLKELIIRLLSESEDE